MRQVVLYGARVVLVTSISLYSGGLVARWGYGHFLTPTQGASFDTFTGLSRGGVSGSSGRRFQDHQCREYRGSSKLPAKAETPVRGKGKRCEQWVVITTINPPTETMKAIAKIEGWCLVLVFDRKTPEAAYTGLASDSLVLFTVRQQIEFMEELGLKSVELIPWNHFGRKNVGFLYAIAHGAAVIYDTDDDNIPLRAELGLGSTMVDLRSQERTVNIYNMFTEHKVWPRGFPLEDIHRKTEVTCCTRKEGGDSVWVQQFLAQHDPDVDAIYRLTSSLPLDFNTSRPGFSLPPTTYVPYNAQATLHRREAFFGLLLPITVHGRVSDIWRSYFSQKLLHLAGASVAFLPPLVRQDRNSHDYLADLDSEVPLYMKAGQLVAFLQAWTPPRPAMDPQEIVFQLAVDMYQHCYWEEGDVKLVGAWLSDLTSLGYSLPPMAGVEDQPPCSQVPC